MGESEITGPVVREAIRGIKFPKNRPNSSLLNSELVQTRLREEGRPTSYQARWMALRLILEEIVREERRCLQGGPSQNESSEEREAWAALYDWCFAPEQLTQTAIGEKLGFDKKTVERRLGLSYELLVPAIRSREREITVPLYPSLGRTRTQKGVRQESPSYGDIPPTAAEKREQADQVLALLAKEIREKGAPAQLSRDSLEALRTRPAETIEEYLLKRIAAWQQRSLSLDQRFVELSLWLDSAGVPGVTPATKSARRFSSLEEALIDLTERLLVVIGEPGAGKTTLLEHLEHETAVSTVLGTESGSIPFLVRLKTLPQLPKEQPAVLRAWLQRQWARRYAELPPLAALIKDGRLLLLLDGLNEIAHRDLKAYAAYARQWRSCAEEILMTHSGNRIVFSCRTLDYTTPLSSRERPVPRLEISPLDESGIREFLKTHLPEQADAVWEAIVEKSLAGVVQVPLVLKHLVKIVAATGGLPEGLAGIFTAFVREALKHEIAWGNPLFDPAGVLADRDLRRIERATHWASEWELPERGPLFPALSTLALAMHRADRSRATDGGALKYEEALAAIAQDEAEDILRAGMALGILEDDVDGDAVEFVHQQTQAYFVARTLARSRQTDQAHREWLREEVSPSLCEVLESLHPAEPLPPLPQSGWEEATLLAAEMADDPDTYVRGVAAGNLSLAGRCVAVPAVQARLSSRRMSSLCDALVARSRNQEADFRDRVDCAIALGRLTDPRFESCSGPFGAYLLPPMIEIEGGEYGIGADQPIEVYGHVWRSHMPRHTVPLVAFALGQFSVTNREWRLFLESGGYEEERWWDTPDARSWRQGVGTARGWKEDLSYWRQQFAEKPELMEEYHKNGSWDDDALARWRRRIEISDAAFAEELDELFPGGRFREPAAWKNPGFNNPSQPVVGVSWFEVRAYCAWLSAQSGRKYRLPTEVEWEAAAAGKEGRLFPYGEEFDIEAGNVVELHMRRTTPIGVLPHGDTPDGIADLAGNVGEWTSTLWGRQKARDPYAYPYRAEDRREDPSCDGGVHRVVRGGSWAIGALDSRCQIRNDQHAYNRNTAIGFRLALSV